MILLLPLVHSAQQKNEKSLRERPGGWISAYQYNSRSCDIILNVKFKFLIQKDRYEASNQDKQFRVKPE